MNVRNWAAIVIAIMASLVAGIGIGITIPQPVHSDCPTVISTDQMHIRNA